MGNIGGLLCCINPTSRNVFLHRLPAICAACINTLGLSLAITASTSCSFLIISYTDPHTASTPMISDLPAQPSIRQDVYYRPTSLGVLSPCFLEEVEKNGMVIVAQWFSRITIGLGCINVVLSWLLSTVMAPTDGLWRCLSLVCAMTAVGQIPIFLIVEANPCLSGTCILGSGAILCICSILCSITVTILTQYIETPTWAILLYDPWKLPASDEHVEEEISQDYFEDDPTPKTTIATRKKWFGFKSKTKATKTSVGMMMVNTQSHTLPDPTSLLLPEHNNTKEQYHYYNDYYPEDVEEDENDVITMEASLDDFAPLKEELITSNKTPYSTSNNLLYNDHDDLENQKSSKQLQPTTVLPSPTGVNDFFEQPPPPPNNNDNVVVIVSKTLDDDPSVQDYSSCSSDDDDDNNNTTTRNRNNRRTPSIISSASSSTTSSIQSGGSRRSSNGRSKRRRRRRKKRHTSYNNMSSSCSSASSSLLDITIEEETDLDVENEETGNILLQTNPIILSGIAIVNKDNHHHPTSTNDNNSNCIIKLDNSIVDTYGSDEASL